MRRALILLPIVLAFATIGMLASGGPSPARGETVSVEVGNLYFCDVSHQEGICETTITSGDTVTWNNVAGFHTVTECDDSFSTCPPAGGFDSGQLATGNSFSHKFDSPGVFEYHCSFHPTDMKGRITVQAQATATPTAAPTASPSSTASTTSPTATAAPVAVPRTGGAGDEDGDAGAITLLALGGLLIVAAGIGLRQQRNERDSG